MLLFSSQVLDTFHIGRWNGKIIQRIDENYQVNKRISQMAEAQLRQVLLGKGNKAADMAVCGCCDGFRPAIFHLFVIAI